MEEDIGDTRVKHDTINVAAHFRFMDPAYQLVSRLGGSALL
jgi:hypothetical protein